MYPNQGCLTFNDHAKNKVQKFHNICAPYLCSWEIQYIQKFENKLIHPEKINVKNSTFIT